MSDRRVLPARSSTVTAMNKGGVSSPETPQEGEVVDLKQPGPGATIFLVEDDVEVREVTRLVLQRHGYRVLCADSEAQALSVWERNQGHIDLLITDVMIPNCATGYRLARRLRLDKPKLGVVFTSGFSPEMGQDDTQFLHQRMFLQKPYTASALIEMVAKCLQETGGVEPGW